MIISHGRGYIFVHIPKTGGTAMALALEDRAKADDIMIGDTPKATKRRNRVKDVQTRGRLWKHSTLADAEGLITPRDMTDLFTFTLVRNPWDRMVSYYHWLKEQSFDHPAVMLAKTKGFSGFLNAPLPTKTFRANPYASYLTDSAGVHHADLYIRLEHLTSGLSARRPRGQSKQPPAGLARLLHRSGCRTFGQYLRHRHRNLRLHLRPRLIVSRFRVNHVLNGRFNAN